MRFLVVIIFSVFIQVSTFSQAFSPEFMYSIGLGTTVLVNDFQITSGYAASQSGRVNLVNLNSQSCLSIGAKLMNSFSFESVNGNSLMTYYVEAPIVAELNFGYKSSSKSKGKKRNYWEKSRKGGFGGFIGGGYSYLGSGYRLSIGGEKESDYVNYFGPHFGGGVRFRFRKKKSITLRVSTTAIKEPEINRTIFIGTEYNF